MRPQSILALLTFALLSSCEPSQESVGTRGDADEDADSPLGHEVTNPERIAAHHSVGRAPLPRTLAKGTADICPVHHEKMNVREVPIAYSETTPAKGVPSEIQAAAEFPFGTEKIISSENALLPAESPSAYVQQCAACISARRAAEVKLTASARR